MSQAATPNPEALHPAIVASNSAADVLRAAATDPALQATFTAAFATQIAAAQKNPLAMVLGALVGWFGARQGFAVDPQIAALMGLMLAMLAGDVSQRVDAWWKGRRAIVAAK